MICVTAPIARRCSQSLRSTKRRSESPPRSTPLPPCGAPRRAPAPAARRAAMKSAALSGNTGTIQRSGSATERAPGRCPMGAGGRARPGHQHAIDDSAPARAGRAARARRARRDGEIRHQPRPSTAAARAPRWKAAAAAAAARHPPGPAPQARRAGAPDRANGAAPPSIFTMLLEGREIGDAAQHRHQQPRVGHDRERRHRVSREQELEQSPSAPARATIASSPARAGDAGGKPARVRRAVAIGGVEAEEAQNAQIILGDALGRLADEAHAPRFEIGKPADSSRAPRRRASPTARSW